MASPGAGGHGWPPTRRLPSCTRATTTNPPRHTHVAVLWLAVVVLTTTSPTLHTVAADAVSLPADDACLRDLPSTCTEANEYCASFRAGIDLVVPSYERELCKLELLAKSVRVHDGCGLVKAVHVGWISTSPVSEYRDALRRVEAAFGPRYSITYHDWSEKRATGSGWFDQQIFKLAAHAVVQTENYLVLDSKNIFVNAITLRSLFGLHRLDLRIVRNMPAARWYYGAAEELRVPLDADLKLKRTLTPFLFNTQRVAALVKWFMDARGQTPAGFFQHLAAQEDNSHGSTMTEFSLYEAFACCHPEGQHAGAPDPWRDLPWDEAKHHAHFNLLTFHGHYSDDTINALRVPVHNDTAFAKLLVLGWHKHIPALVVAPDDAASSEELAASSSSGELVPDAASTARAAHKHVNVTFFASFAAALGALYRKAGVLRDDDEECEFYTRCMSHAVPCAPGAKPPPHR